MYSSLSEASIWCFSPSHTTTQLKKPNLHLIIFNKTTSVAKNIIIKQPVIAGLTRNPFNNQGMLKQVQHDAYVITSATEVVLFLELGKNTVSSHCSSIPFGSLRSDNLQLQNKVSSLRDFLDTRLVFVRRLKPTVNKVPSLRDYLAAQSAAKSCKDDPLLTVDAIYGRKTARIPAKSCKDDPLLTVDAIYGRKTARIPAKSCKDAPLLTVDAIYGRKTARIAAKSCKDDPLLTVDAIYGRKRHELQQSPARTTLY
ncbi:MAG: hypothetical protein FWH18_12335 [Marinilabiliaceae bacterium]|nr:hypothetical protein [Marinilabiliaceae bacterium]